MTAARLLDWRLIERKKDATFLQQFECTQPWPKTPGGRKLPRHPRSWEFDAQRHVRNLSTLMHAGDRVLVGFDTSGEADVTAAVLHLRIELKQPTRLIAHVMVGAVAVSHRSPNPPYLGDEIMDLALAEAQTAMATHSCTRGMLAGHIHVENHASMRMAARNAWEPLEGADFGEYVPWGRALR